MRIKRLIILITTVVGGIFCIHADDLSDLVSFIAGSSSATGTSSATVKGPQWILSVTKQQSANINADMLGNIAALMTEDASYNYILNSVSGTGTTHNNPFQASTSRPWSQGPTLGKRGFFRPVPGILTSKFGWRQQFNRMHHGVDMLLNVGDTVRSALSGVVKKVAYDADGYGNYVVLTHPDGMETVYGHLQYALVGQGQPVDIGMPVGIGGNTGNSTGPHLHFEARMNGVAVDPTMIFNFSGSYTSLKTQQDYADKTQPGNPLLGSPLTNRRTYIIRQGDTLKSIARRAGISVVRLCQLNMLSEYAPLEIGRMLKLK